MDTNIRAKPKIGIIQPDKDIKLEPGEVGAILELVVKDKNGKVTHREEMVSRSFVRQWLELVYIQALSIYSGAAYTLRDKDNALQRVSRHYYNLSCHGGVGEENYGITVGTGITAPTINDYRMETPIAHGTSAGQLGYSAVTFGAPATDGSTSQFTITRDFANSSGGAITVREIGLYVRGSTGYYLAVRDAVNISIPNGETLTVNYRIQGTV